MVLTTYSTGDIGEEQIIDDVKIITVVRTTTDIFIIIISSI